MIVFIFILGLCVGSFLNVFIDRSRAGVSSLTGRSHCDFCHKSLSPIDLIPIASFIVLEGKCRYCKKKLSWQYPLVEFITGCMFVFIFLQAIQIFGCQLPALSSAQTSAISCGIRILPLFLIGACFLVIFVCDLKYQIIPDEMLFIIFTCVLLFQLMSRSNKIEYIISGVICFSLFLIIYHLTRGKGMGFGDVKLAFVIGYVLGLQKGLLALYLAFLTGAVVSIILILLKIKKLKQRIAFGPFMLLGAVMSYYLGEEIILWYLNFLH